MKKTIIASTLATAMATTGIFGIVGNDADASEQNINQSQLAQSAQANDGSLNEKPLHAGAYDYKFNHNGFDYHFWSDGTNFGHEFHEGDAYPSDVPEVAKSHVGTNQAPSTSQPIASTQSYNTTSDQAVEAPKASTSSQSDVVKTQSAPKASTSSQSDVVKTQSAPKASTSASDGSVKAQFLNAGGTEAMWQSIVMPESTGNPNAKNGQYSGLFQMSPQSGNGTGSVAEQTKSAIKYANERYGSVDNAISARASQGWW